jgi:hypothetical protein
VLSEAVLPYEQNVTFMQSSHFIIAYSSNEVSFTATITTTTATFNGTIITVGDPAYTERGFVYAQVHNPTIEDTKKIVTGSGIGIFSTNIIGTTNVTYYVRAYAINSSGTAYGEEVSFIFTSSEYIILQASGLMVQKTDLGSADWSTAMTLCSSSQVGGFTDWYLPTKAELAILYNGRTTIGGFSASDYWSSTETSSGYDDAWIQSFSTGEQDFDHEYNSHRCRCVRTLP